jgi:SAM-dependent methyltransferase
MTRSDRKSIFEALGREFVHPFPARMAPGIALEVLAEAKKPLRVLDPMMGSGTVPAVARSKGHRAIGIDIDPLAVLMSTVWTRAVNTEEVRDKADEVLDRAKGIFATLSQCDAYPRHADYRTRRFVTYWFDGYARRQLTSLATAIARVRNETTRDILWCAFSRLIITKRSGASLAMDLSHSRPHKTFDRAPAKPFLKFREVANRVIDNCIDEKGRGLGPVPRIRLGDARSLPLSDGTVDLVLTSPPYLNAIDYMRCSKFSLVWMGYNIVDLRRLRTESVGSEASKDAAQENQDIQNIIGDLNLRPRLGAREEAVLARYIDDMLRSVREAARVLVPNGKAVYVIGENTVRGTYIRNSVIMTAVAQLSGLRLQDRRVRRLPANRRYLPPPSVGSISAPLDTRMRREAVLTFSKAAR